MWTLQGPLQRLAPALALLGGLPVLGCGAYCLLWYRPPETSFLTPDLAITCWLYCSTLWPPFGALTLASGLAPVGAALLMWRGNYRLGLPLALVSGVLTLPVGVLPLAAAFLARDSTTRQLSESGPGPRALG